MIVFISIFVIINFLFLLFDSRLSNSDNLNSSELKLLKYKKDHPVKNQLINLLFSLIVSIIIFVIYLILSIIYNIIPYNTSPLDGEIEDYFPWWY